MSVLGLVIVAPTTGQVFEGIPDPKPVWGDVTRDRTVDIRDLVQLGQDFQSAEEIYFQPVDKLLDRINTHWAERVPLFLHELAWENQVQLLSSSSGSGKDVSVGNKGAEGFYSLGFGVTFPTGINGDFENAEPGQQVFEPTSRTNTVFNDVRVGGFSEEPGERRYNYPVASEEIDAKYMFSVADEYEFTGLDLNLEARYGLYSGGLRTSFENARYKNDSQHTIVFKITKSFGWYFQPTDEIVLTGAFRNALASVDENRVKRDFGTHYVFAEHRVAELYIKVVFNTLTEEQRQAFGASVNFAYRDPGSAVSFFTSISNIQEQFNAVTDAKMTISRKGGDSNLELLDGTSWDSAWVPVDLLSVGADERQELVDLVREMVDVWTANVTPVNSPPNDFIVRPLSDFFPDPDSNPLSKEASLQRWFRAYLKFIDQIEVLQAIVPQGDSIFGQPYEHFQFASSENFNVIPDNSESWYDYFVAKRDLTGERYANLLEVGREIYAAAPDQNVIFDPNLPEQNETYGLPSYRTPQVVLTVDMISELTCNADFAYYERYFYTPWVELFPRIGNSRSLGRYQIVHALDLRLLPYWVQSQPSRSVIDADYLENGQLRGVLQLYGNHNMPCEEFSSWASTSNGFYLAVYDKVTKKIISYVCVGGPNCTGDIRVLGDVVSGL